MSPTASQNQWICIVFSLLAENDVRIIVSCCLLLIAIYVKDKLGDVQCSYTFAAQHFLKREVIMEGTGIPGFGETVATFRTRAGLSQQKVASVLGMSLRAIAAWEAGDNLPKTKGTVLELARILKLNDKETTMLLKAAGIDPSLAIWNIPFPRNPFFTGRDQELEHLHVQLQQGTTAVVGQAQSVSGLGGIGKTQLAVEYAYRHHSEYQYILWARGESMEALNSSYSELAFLLDLTEKNVQEQEKVIQAVKQWLQRQHGWLLILDNADSPSLLPIFLPPTVGGHLLITTRVADLSSQVAGLSHSLMIDAFSDEQAALFLLHRSGLLLSSMTLDQTDASTRQLALEIAHELAGLPLALDQAAAYLNATCCNLATYQQIYQKHRSQLLAERRSVDHPEPVATTWDISFRKIEEQNPAAADLLRLCAFLAPDIIPEEIFIIGADELGPLLAPVAADVYRFNEAIESLRASSLLARSPYTQTLTVHRIVQAVLRDTLPIQAQQQWMLRAVHAVEATYPSDFVGDFSHESFLRNLLWPHVRICATWIEQASFVTSSAASLLTHAGDYPSARLQFGEAEPLYQRALSIRVQQFGTMHPLSVASLLCLAGLYHDQGKYEEAEPLYQRALSIHEEQFRATHPLITIILENLARVYQSLGKCEEAELLYQRILAINEQERGATCPDTARSLYNLAMHYQVQGRYEEAEPLYQRALSIREQRLGSTHSDTAFTLGNLVNIYVIQGKYEEAELLFKHTVSIREQEWGPTHPYTASSLENLGRLYQSQGRYGEAEPLYQRALSIYELCLGKMDPETQTAYKNYATLLRTMGRSAEAKQLEER